MHFLTNQHSPLQGIWRQGNVNVMVSRGMVAKRKSKPAGISVRAIFCFDLKGKKLGEFIKQLYIQII